MKANITISRRSDNDVYIVISDADAGVKIVEVSMTPSEFTMAVTGLARSKGEIRDVITAEGLRKVGRKMVVEERFCPKVSSYKKEDQKAQVIAHLELNDPDGEWYLSNDGTRSQQNGAEHHYTVAKWV